MKIAKGLSWLVLLMPAAGFSGERNPFIPPVTDCELTYAELSQWRLFGLLLDKKNPLALVSTPQGNIRLSLGIEVLNMARVIEISQYRVRLSLAYRCDGAHYHLSGGYHEKRRDRIFAVTAPLLQPSQPTYLSVPG